MYREIRIDDDGSLHSRQLDEWLFLDGQNKLLQKKRADSVIAIGKNLLSVTTAGFIQVVDYQLNPLSTPKFSTLGKFIHGKGVFSIGNKYGIANKNGSILLNAKFDNLYSDQHFFISNQKQAGKDNWVVLDSLGKALNTKPYDRIHPFNGKVFPVVKGNFWGAINSSGKEIIACSYDSILQQLDENLVVKFRGQYGIINLNEQWIVTPRPNKLRLITDQRFIEITPKTTYLKSFDGNAIYFSENKLEISAAHIIEYLPSGNLWEIDLNGIIVNRQVQPEGAIEKIFPE